MSHKNKYLYYIKIRSRSLHETCDIHDSAATSKNNTDTNTIISLNEFDSSSSAPLSSINIIYLKFSN